METNTRRGFLALTIGPAAALALQSTAATAASVAPHSDADLIRLGREMDEAWAAQRIVGAALDAGEVTHEQYDAAYSRTSAIVDQIERATAATLDGLRVKAQAVSWCHGGEHLELNSLCEQPTTDLRLATAIVRDLLAMGGTA